MSNITTSRTDFYLILQLDKIACYVVILRKHRLATKDRLIRTDIHPSLVTLPVEWDYEIPYGIVYAKNPSKPVTEFINVIQKSLK